MAKEQPAPDCVAVGASSQQGPTRRRALGLGAWSAAVAAGGALAARRRAGGDTVLDGDRVVGHRTMPAATAATSSAPPTASAATTGPPPIDSDASAAAPEAAPSGGRLTGDALVLHVARRASFGPTSALLAEISSVGVDAWLDQQLRPAEIEDPDVDPVLARLPDLHRSPHEFRAARRGDTDDVLMQLRVAAVARAVLSRRQLHEVMVDLWHDRLAASAAKSPVAWFLPAYDKSAIRPHALGRFADLLKAVTRSGAMLEYLDTAGSAAPKVNENHGRELLELHTVGRGSGFSQSDVDGASRVLSGWTLAPGDLRVVFDATRHHSGPAEVLGWSTPGRSGPGAAAELDAMLEHLAAHPATAQRVATSLVQRFVADLPPSDAVASTAAAYLASGTDIAATLRHLFGTDAFRSGGAPILRRPLDLFAAQLRATSAEVRVANLVERVAGGTGLLPLVQPIVDGTNVLEPLVSEIAEERSVGGPIAAVLHRNGQPLFAAPHPSGFPVSGSSWGSGDALLRRWTLGAYLAQDALPGISVDPESLAGGSATAGAAVDELARRCFAAAPSAATRAGALAVMERDDAAAIGHVSSLRRALAFLLAAPEMQVR